MEYREYINVILYLICVVLSILYKENCISKNGKLTFYIIFSIFIYLLFLSVVKLL